MEMLKDVVEKRNTSGILTAEELDRHRRQMQAWLDDAFDRYTRSSLRNVLTLQPEEAE